MDFTHPKIMGVLNVTPDSFSDGGKFLDPDKAMARIREMIDQGADIIDLGGESTRPDSMEVSLDEELSRVRPIIDRLAASNLLERATFSIDTYKALVAEYALRNRFNMVNDITAVRADPTMPDVLLSYQPSVILMYSKDFSPRTTKNNKDYDDVIITISDFLLERIDFLTNNGFPREKIIIDPGAGLFVSPNPKYTLEIIERLSEFKKFGCPILMGISRKIPNADSGDLSLKAIQNGANIVRVHDIKKIKDRL